MNYNLNEQPLGFDRVLLFGEEAEPVQWIDGKCYIAIHAPEAKKVTGTLPDGEHEFEKWEDGIWRMEYGAESGFSYFLLRVDGAEVLSPLLLMTHGYSRPVNYIAIEKPNEDFYRIKDVPHGSVRREYFRSSATGEWESCIVYTPYEYDRDPEKEFPVLYLQHGHGENEIGWTAAGKVNFILDNLIAEEKINPFVVVMSCGMVQTVLPDGRRETDFHLFENLLLEDVMPFIESRFRVGRSKNMRALAGLSMGSLQTSMIGFKHPELFSALGVFSGFVTDVITGNQHDAIRDEPGDNAHLKILEDAEKFAAQYPVFFRAVGDADEMREHFYADDRMLEEKGIRHIRKIYPGGIHDWNVWRMCIRDFSQLIFKTE